MKSVIILLLLVTFSIPAHSEEKLTSTEPNKDWSFLTDIPAEEQQKMNNLLDAMWKIYNESLIEDLDKIRPLIKMKIDPEEKNG